MFEIYYDKKGKKYLNIDYYIINIYAHWEYTKYRKEKQRLIKHKLKIENCNNWKIIHVSESAYLNLMSNAKNYAERHKKSS